jgi:hypothetical protein
MVRKGYNVIVMAGPRDWTNEAIIHSTLNKIADKYGVWDTVIIDGGAIGFDRIVHRLAKEIGFHVGQFEANWDFNYNGAGPLRNTLMLDLLKPMGVVVGKRKGKNWTPGTNELRTKAIKRGIPVKIMESEF